MTCVEGTTPTEIERTLRSSSAVPRNETQQHDDDYAEDVALETAEEKLLMEQEHEHEHDDGLGDVVHEDDDEEIESCDESGKPVVDTQKLERRMMTVALVKSVVETSGGGKKKDDSAADDNDGVAAAAAAAAAGTDDEKKRPHGYGLRKRNSKGGRDSPDDEESSTSRRRTRSNKAARRTNPVKKRPVPAALATTSSAASSRIGDSSSSSAAGHGSGPMNRGLPSTHQVPNPLSKTAMNPQPHPRAVDPSMRVVAPPSSSTVPLPPVPCPLPKGESNSDCLPDAAVSAPAAPAGRINDSDAPGAARRGRIFSIDIDPEGLEFPDMNIDVAMQSIQPNRVRSASIEQGSQGDSSKASVTFKPQQSEHKDSLDVSLPSSGRGRAMSFEFFSFGINADEPLPPVAPDASATEVAPAFTRPRGDSIIFEPDSFKDGGVLEEHALLKTRTGSIDLASAPEEVSLMNTPGFAPAPPSSALEKPMAASQQPPASNRPNRSTSGGAPKRQARTKSAAIPATFSHADRSASASTSYANSKAAEMATLPSTLSSNGGNGNNGSIPSHATFQMDLLNKDGRIGIYLPEARKARIAKFHSKRKMRIWRKRIKYDCRKKLADSRPRIKGRFVKRSDVEDE